MSTSSSRSDSWLGMNWIRQSKRLAIYLRDGLACAYCGHAVEDGAQLTLDHCKPHSKGGCNKETNLVTACHRCNSSRGNRSMASFIAAVAEYTAGREDARSAAQISQHITNCRKRKLDMAAAKEMIERRGSCKKALEI